MFGGENYVSTFGDTWEWDGNEWLLRATTGPQPRRFHAMAFDAVRNVTVLYGGSSDPDITWEWDGQTWTQLAANGPGPRSQHSMSFDSQRQVTLLFGGANDGQVWEWNGSEWTSTALVGPSARYGHSMAYDASVGATVLFGGRDADNNMLAESWKLQSKPMIWVRSSSSGPLERIRSCMVFDSARQRSLLFGGLVRSSLGADLWSFVASASGDSWTFAGNSGPTTLGNAMAFDPVSNSTILFASDQAEPFGRTWGWNGVVWNLLTADGPSSRFNSSMAFDIRRRVLVLFGGVNGFETPLGDTWEWNGTSWRQVASAGPPPRWGSSMTFDSAKSVVVLFGGTTDNLHGFSDTWEWDGAQWRLKSESGPAGRHGHAMAYDEVREESIMFGGQLWDGLNNIYPRDTWGWNGDAWIQRANLLSAPDSQRHACMAYDPFRRVVIMPGMNPQTFGNQTWIWNGSAWNIATQEGPVGDSSAAAFDTSRRLLVLFGGAGGRSTWEYGFDPDCSGDINNDGSVDVDDLLAVINAWGDCPPPCSADVAPPPAGDGVVNVDDLLLVINHWG